MDCVAKDNAVKYLFKKGATNDVRKVIDFQKFEKENDNITTIAETKYGLNTNGAKLFTIQYEAINYVADTPYYRENKYTVPRAIPNEKLFEELDRLIRIYNMKKDQGLNSPEQPMMMRTPEVSYNLKVINALNKISRNKFEPEKLQGWLNDLQKQGVSAQQIEMFKQVAKPGMTKDEIALEIATLYSYTVEINTQMSRQDKKGDDFYKPFFSDNRNMQGKDPWGVEYGDGNLRYFKTKAEAEEYVKNRDAGRPTEYYSNLTVPGGINYTENEIATPAITPSIKGHAQFATDKGIGWFRSDDKAPTRIERKDLGTFEVGNDIYTQEFDTVKIETTYYKNNKQISKEEYNKANLKQPDFKTRRILEVQSDLFQKGRDRKELASDLSDIEEKKWIKETEKLKREYLKKNITKEEYDMKMLELDKLYPEKDVTKENQFLQLLNKDNNWVTFFVKSIIQDSAKKGYEKVLFPVGDTASKIEGHTTLEEFKKQKEDRIKELEKDLAKHEKQIKEDKKTIQKIKKTLSESTFLTKEDLGYVIEKNSDYPDGVALLINKNTKEKISITRGYWANPIFSLAKNAEESFNKFLNGETVFKEANIAKVYDLEKKSNLEQRLKDLESYVQKNNTKNNITKEIDQLKQELERIEGPEGFGALRPIYNFYENTIANILKKQGYSPKQVTDEYGNTWNEVTVEQTRDLDPIAFMRETEDMFAEIPEIEIDIQSLNNQRAKEAANALANKLATALGVSFRNVTAEEAMNILKDRVIGYKGEPAFYFAGTVYIVGDNINMHTVLHEFAHPLLQAIKRDNPELFAKLYDQLAGTGEGEGIKEYVKKNYPELAEDSDLFKEEVLAFALQLKAVNKATGQAETQGFIDFIKNLLYSIKQALKKAFNIKQGVEDINVDTTIERLAEKLLGEEFDLKIPKVTAQDVEMFARFNIESVKQLTENASVKSINEIVNRLYQADLEIISKAESFVGDKASQKIIRESIFNQGTTELAKGIKKSLRGYQTVTASQQATVEEKINNALEAEKRRIEDLNNKAVSLVTSLGLTDEMLKNIVNELTLLQKGNYTNPHKVAVINLFKGISRRLYQTTADIDQVLKKDFAFDTSNPLAQMLNEITRNAIRAEELVREMSKEITTSKLVEITGYMTQFVEDEMKSDLGNILKNILSEQELNEFINKIIDQQVTDADINAVIAKDPTGRIESKYINKFIGRYNQYILNAPKIRAVLEGKTRDVSPVSRFLESYSSSNNPVIGGISTWIEDQKTEAEQRVWKRAMDFKVQLETLLPAVGFSKSNTRQLLDMLTFEDEVVGYNRKTGAIERKTVYSFLNAHGNGWRYELDSREFAVFEARRNGDEAALKTAETELRNFKRNYMYDEYVAEYYEKDDIFQKYPLGNEAWLDRKLALDSFNAEQNKLHNETERFENYSQVQEAWRKYQQLYSLRYEDGTMKTGNDFEKAKILIEYRTATRDYYEFVPIKGSLQTAYNEFVNLKKAQGLSKEELDTEVKKWIKQNTKILYSEEYYKDKSRLLGRLRELQNKINESANTTFNPSEAFDEVFDLINSYRDEQGQPMATLLSKDKLGRIKQLQQEINNYRQSVDKKTGLSNELLAELNAFIKRHKQGETLSEEEQKRYLYLSDLSSESGLSAYELAEFDNILSELGNLSTRIPTDYYMDELNFNLSKHNIKAKTEDEVDEYINTEEFRELVKSDDNFFEWFKLNHVNKKVYVKGKGLVTRQERTFANSVSIPKDTSHIVTTEIIDSETGKPIIIKGVPNSRHSFFKVKDKYRTIPFGLTKEEKAKYIGTVIDNKGNYLPRPHNPGQKNSAVDGKFINKRYMDLKAANNAEFRLLEAVTKFHLETQDGKSNYSKLYMDMPRFAIKGVVEAFQAGKYGEKAGQIKESVNEWWKQKFGKSVKDAENEFNYNAENNLVNTDLNGDEITYIPVQGLYKLDPKATNPDVMENILKYALSVEEQSQLYKTLPLIETMLDTLADKDAQPKNMEAYSRNLKAVFNELRNPNKKFGTNNLLGQLQSLVQREYYGVKNSDVSEQYPQLTKFLGSLQGLSAQASLAINLPSDLKNQYAGYVQLIIEAAGAEFVNMKDLAVGRGFSFKTMMNWSSFGSRGIYAVGPGDLYVQLVELFDPAFRTQDNFGRSISRHIWKDLVNGEWKYMHRKFGELEVALTLFGSMLNAEKVEQKLPDGTVKILHYQDTWEKDADGIVKLKAGIHPGWSNQAVKHVFKAGEKLTDIAKRYGVTVEEIKRANSIKDEVDLNDDQEITIANSEKFKQFKRKVQGLSRALFGAYDEMGQPEGNKYLMYRMFFFMRKWFTPMFVNRFGIDMNKEANPYGERYDWALGRTRKGFYIQAFQTLLEGMKTMGKSFKYMSKKEKVALRKAAAEGTAIIMFSVLASMIFGYDDDDEEKWAKIRERSGVIGSDEFNTWGFMQNHMLALMMGLQAETSAFVPLPKIAGINLGADDYAGLLTSTTTAFGNTILLYLEILSDLFNLVTFNDLSVYKKEAGPYSWEEKDDYKIVNHIFRTFGFTGSSGDPETIVKNLRNSASRIGR